MNILPGITIPDTALPDTAALLVSGGDARITVDPSSGISMYGCRPCPDPDLVALGSCTASLISEAGFAAASALRQHCVEQLRVNSPGVVYAEQAARLRSELLACCGLAPADGVEAVLAASGTDLFLLAAQWLKPQRTVMVAAGETGSGVPAALHGRHFNGRAACAGEVPIGALVGDWEGDLVALAVRAQDGSLRAAASVDADCAASVGAAAAAGQRVLLVLTDVSKTGLIVPSIEVALAMQRRFPAQVEVLVDACQFRLSAPTLRAYLAQDWMVALTGSKFIGGPTFCGALLVPRACAARYRDAPLNAGVNAYSNANDWPPAWRSGQCLPATGNFGLLLRWAAALSGLRLFVSVPEARIAAFLQRFADTVNARLALDDCLEALPVPPLSRRALGIAGAWDTRQSIFPFLIHVPDEAGGRRPLKREETERLQKALLNPAAGARRFQLGQAVACGVRDGVPVSALRLCVSARMVVTACTDEGAEEGAGKGCERALADALAALDEVARLVKKIGQAERLAA